MGGARRRLSEQDETSLTLLGLLTFSDPPKPDLPATLQELSHLGVSLKIITGDSRHVAAHLCDQLGVDGRAILTGDDLRHISKEALVPRAEQTSVFAEVEPNQKETLVLALRKAGNVVGFLGDGINDAPALHAADVSISVDQATDVAKEAADIVLLGGIVISYWGVAEFAKRPFYGLTKRQGGVRWLHKRRSYCA